MNNPNAPGKLDAPSGVGSSRLVRRIPVDFRSIAAETGIRRGKVCHSAWFGWCVQCRDDAVMASITTPLTQPDETLVVESGHWCVYAPND